MRDYSSHYTAGNSRRLTQIIQNPSLYLSLLK